ncbi:MAG: hypothetical protein SCH70_03445 [Candidatus Methanoperedens sp.]|nr:hypothetical protein [Candidatus Methanoperedens sp.]
MNQVIRNNQNGRGASIEKVVSEAVKIGTERTDEQLWTKQWDILLLLP